YNMMHSRHGRAILAVRDNEIAAESCGISLTFYKAFGFTVSAFFAGIAGGLYASYFGLLNPEKFGFMQSIEILVMVVLGGVGSMFGSALAAAILTILPQVLIFLDDYRMLVYSLLLILVMVYNYAPVFEPLRERFSFAVLAGKFRGKKPSGEEERA
ncbi:MAG: branched-chain amino acid ABC transporter permease, partial [Ruminococcus sp.]|nr:branched-chain amino acid ABC transporter permease [Candidatus Apopatosoma intestinale]